MIDLAHIHPMLVHFPLALLPVALASQAIALWRDDNLFGRSCVAQSAFWLYVLSALGAISAAIFGDMAFDIARESGVSTNLMEGHEELGMLSAWLLSGITVVFAFFYRKQVGSRPLAITFFIAGISVLALVLITAWHGGQLVYEHGVNVHTLR